MINGKKYELLIIILDKKKNPTARACFIISYIKKHFRNN